MALKFTVDTSGLAALKAQLAEVCDRTENVVAIQAAKDTEPFVPAGEKSLANRTQVVGDTIIYPGPYARYLYYGKLMVDPDTGSAWARKGATKVLTDKDLVFRRDVHAQAQSHWFEASKAQNLDKWLRKAAKEVTRGKGK